ncbi:hypothetical protein BJ508DRAFT_302891 [Ascobolus immersus RN42]|uniref:Uncharacterized protein n=1 Tax=Ascobolus immersus RN42 TaxID=1160509 RepID=A0A3N4IJ21_ASCIM|nr:hypothetical protein BJ508DRAFT_302891 [Ascobolus immersus RN42]
MHYYELVKELRIKQQASSLSESRKTSRTYVCIQTAGFCIREKGSSESRITSGMATPELYLVPPMATTRASTSLGSSSTTYQASTSCNSQHPAKQQEPDDNTDLTRPPRSRLEITGGKSHFGVRVEFQDHTETSDEQEEQHHQTRVIIQPNHEWFKKEYVSNTSRNSQHRMKQKIEHGSHPDYAD